MSAPSAAPRSGRTTRLSQFTNLDLQLLAQSSPESPLRVVALVDCDAFYAQCETIRLGIPTSRPLAVRQWNAIIALNHPARKNNLKRGMSVDEVRQLCPGIKLPLPTITGLRDWEPDTTVAFSDGEFPERELDWDDVVLLIGAGIVRSIRKEMRKQLQLTTSAGVSHNKMLAKMASRINKPNQQTITGRRSAPALLYNSNISDLPRLGGQLGLKVSLCFASDKISDILRDPLAAMAERLGTEHAQWVYDAIRGREKSPVVARSQVQSLLSAKTFVPFLTGLHQAKRWLRIFAADLEARLRDLEADSVFPRRPGTIAVHHRIRGTKASGIGREGPRLGIKDNTNVTLWLNGGPGSDSFIGLFEEIGPCEVVENMTTVLRDHSWTEISNLLFLSQLVGTGFSYRTRWEVLQGFYSTLPQLSDSKISSTDFRLWVGSFGGHWGPAFFTYFSEQNELLDEDTMKGRKLNMKSLGKNKGYGVDLVNDTIYEMGKWNRDRPGGCQGKMDYCAWLDRDSLPWLNTAPVQNALGANLNYTSSNLLYSGFTLSGDFAVGYLKDIEKLLESDVQIALVFGDADYICNWPGGEALSLAADWSGAGEFHDAGYTNLVVEGKAYGETRQYGKLSFTRVWNAGHEIPYFQPEASFQIFNRTTNRFDIATGKVRITADSTHKTNGTAKTTRTTTLPPLSAETKD
ncbi:hypothetical protein QQX98_009377 [Neonectria punicea]|uniref:UmuC domain-containing protein n=1 Tax=Neonectria punicea TaxID=979145 RepID=A0ABR1GSG8_9HYPO